MGTYIEHVSLRGIHDRYNLDVDFDKSLNVLHGKNGTGKSTLIHVIANIVNCDFIRFCFLDFDLVDVRYSNGNSVEICRLDVDSDVIIRLKASNGSELSFSKRDALESIRKYDDDRYVGDYIPELHKAIKEFSSVNNIKEVGAAYFPAFRTMLEAWSSQSDRDERRFRGDVNTKRATSFARNLFGQFLPDINYPSPLDIEDKLREEIRDAQMRIGRYDSSIFSDSFVKVFSALIAGQSSGSDDPQVILDEISRFSNPVQSNTKRGYFEVYSNTYLELKSLIDRIESTAELDKSVLGALSVYRDALKERIDFQDGTFEKVDRYFKAVNAFLEHKELTYEFDPRKRMPKVGLKFSDDTWSSVRVMSSGERQLLTMLYAVTKMSGDSVVLIDEPELSLHIDWQEELLSKMMDQLGERQIIVCTHSPSIAAEFGDKMQEIKPVFIRSRQVDEIDDEEELI